MINKTFCHVPGISETSEKLLWENGITSWDEFIENFENINCLTKNQLDKIYSELTFSKEAFENKNINYFKSLLPQNEHWRLSDLGKVAFVDIETTGLSRWTDQITLIGIYDGDFPHIFINGVNLEDAKEKLKEFDVIVTFNGKQFDLPFIEHKFQEKYDVLHLDLRFMLKEFGLSGGLKKIENELGVNRCEEVQDVDGREAVRLWRKYKQGDRTALATLLKYNEEDIVNLKYLLNWYLDKKAGELSVENVV